LNFEHEATGLNGIAMCLKSGIIHSITFDYQNPAPFIYGLDSDKSKTNQISTNEDIRQNFLSNKHFRQVGNQEFYDNGKSYLVHPMFGNMP